MKQNGTQKDIIHCTCASALYPTQIIHWDKCNLTHFSTNFRFEDFSLILPRAGENSVAGYMLPAGLQFDYTDLGGIIWRYMEIWLLFYVGGTICNITMVFSFHWMKSFWSRGWSRKTWDAWSWNQSRWLKFEFRLHSPTTRHGWFTVAALVDGCCYDEQLNR